MADAVQFTLSPSRSLDGLEFSASKALFLIRISNFESRSIHFVVYQSASIDPFTHHSCHTRTQRREEVNPSVVCIRLNQMYLLTCVCFGSLSDFATTDE